MNTFGSIFRVSIFGESHGQSVGITIDGCPAGLPLTISDFLPDLERRKGGTQKGTTPRQEEDLPIFMSGIFNDHTTGAPLTIIFENKNTRSTDYEKQRAVPRPGHADFTARQKFGGYEDFRGSGHFSGRLTVALVAAGVVAKKLLDQVDDFPTSPLAPLQGRGESSSSGMPGYVTADVVQWKTLSEIAISNRANPTEAETIMWNELRNRKLDGFKFRRQQPLYDFIPDFICIERKLVVEVDGGYHLKKEQKDADAQRDVALNAKGYRVLRFTNEEVINEKERVLKTISTALATAAGSPSPQEREPEGEVGQEITITSAILEIGGETDLEAGLQKAIDAKDSIGGIVECRVAGLPAGLGEPFFNSAESLLAHIVFAIPAVRGIEFGTGFQAARMFGSQHNDPITDMSGHTSTNHAGGIVGGITNGNELVFRIAVKPTSSTAKEQTTLNWETGNMETVSVKGRHDLCIALRVPVVLEAVTAIVLADLLTLEQRIPRIL